MTTATLKKPGHVVFPRHSIKGYAGVGSRETPLDVLGLMEQLASKLRSRGWLLRSGHAPGADQAFERGAMSDAEIFLPWPGFESDVTVYGRVTPEPSIGAHHYTRLHHPASDEGWAKLPRSTRNLHARNAHIVLGRTLDEPVRFLIAWTPEPFPQGGTGQAVRIAKANGIAVVNLAEPDYGARLNRLTGPSNL